MNMHAFIIHEAFPLSAKAQNTRAIFDALFSLSQTQRRLAHRNKREALEWEAKGNQRFYAECRAESDRLWRESKWHLDAARRERAAIINAQFRERNHHVSENHARI